MLETIQTLDLPFLIKLSINLVSLIILVCFGYYRRTRNRELLFSFVLFGMGVYIVMYLLRSVELSMGFTFGLFAIFSMLRYRTEAFSMREMTYLFLVITIALISAVGPVSYLELIILNTLICGGGVAESSWLLPKLHEKIIQYEKIANIKPENRGLLIQDLKERTGLNIQNILIDKIDFLRDTATVKIYFLPEESEMAKRIEPTEIIEPVNKRPT